MTKRAWPLTVGIYAVLVGSTVVILYPLLFMFLASFTTRERYYQSIFLPIPDRLNLGNYAELVTNCTRGCIYVSMQMTLIRVAWYVLVTLLVAILAGYAFARLRFPGRNALFLFFLTGLMVPSILTVLPVYIMLARWPLAGGNDLYGQGGHGFVNEWPALFMLGIVEVLPIFLLKQNYEMLPADYEEAALVDGAGFLSIIFRIYVPMLRPALTAIAILVSVGVWNDFFGPLIFIGGNAQLTVVALQIQRIIYQYTQWSQDTLAPYPLIFAGAALMSIPPMALYLALQRYFVQGLVNVGIKG